MRAMQSRQVVFALSIVLAVFGCGDNGNNNPSDGGPSGDASQDSGGPSGQDAQVGDAGPTDAGALDATVDAGAAADAEAEDAGAGDASADASGPVSFDVTATEPSTTDFKFTPATLTAAPGQQVTVRLKNNGTHAHNIQFDLGNNDQPTINNDVAPGGTGSVTFTAPQTKGTYVFFCPVDSHRDLGMVGSLKVE